MNETVAKLLARMTELEQELEEKIADELTEKRRQFHYKVEKGRIVFESEMRAMHQRLRKNWIQFIWDASFLSILVSPIIYSMIIPFVLLDAWLWLYQTVCFPAYGMEKVKRSQYIFLDRSRLKYLNFIERLNCDFCGYGNGVIAYAREVASRTEQYFCPIKHANHCAGTHPRYGEFIDYGDGESYRKNWKKLRDEMRVRK